MPTPEIGTFMLVQVLQPWKDEEEEGGEVRRAREERRGRKKGEKRRV